MVFIVPRKYDKYCNITGKPLSDCKPPITYLNLLFCNNLLILLINNFGYFEVYFL